MIMNNAFPNRTRAELVRLHDELKSKLRAFGSLGTTQDKCEFLYPLVSSCLPKVALSAWERQRSSEDFWKCLLIKIMTFLQKEVQVQEMVALAVMYQV